MQAAYDILHIVREQHFALGAVVYGYVYCLYKVTVHWQICWWVKYIVYALAWCALYRFNVHKLGRLVANTLVANYVTMYI